MVWDVDSSHGKGETFPDLVVVELFEDGAARVTGFPRGRSVQDEEGYFCIDGPTDERYTGDATWEVRNRFSFFISFGDSKVLVSSGSRFGEQDWTTIRFDSCVEERRWDFSYVCGDSGYGPDDGDLVFREECPVSG
ncbi:hypothetical protein AWU67_08465 [Microterricola viridarii]|uniref:Uncharacterized protein n=2 Tax=Microterricola viridarii TaxID=412690 RepID=A0A0X8E369_9MICO|nr:hypothetical protein AWU67_08465 [Microterricola viridarii]